MFFFSSSFEKTPQKKPNKTKIEQNEKKEKMNKKEKWRTSKNQLANKQRKNPVKLKYGRDVLVLLYYHTVLGYLLFVVQGGWLRT